MVVNGGKRGLFNTKVMPFYIKVLDYSFPLDTLIVEIKYWESHVFFLTNNIWPYRFLTSRPSLIVLT